MGGFEPATLLVVLAGAFLAGFTTGLAGFGTGLVASGFWFHVLPPAFVPPLIALVSVVGQTVGCIVVRKGFLWARVTPFLVGGALGVPLGVYVLSIVSPAGLRGFVGLFLVVYTLAQLLGLSKLRIKAGLGGKPADAAVGVGGGFLGGFAGLSGPAPLIWMQMQGGPSAEQRGVYQPFNLVVLSMAAVSMGLSGQAGPDVLGLAALCVVPTLVGAWLGTRAYGRIGEKAFKRVVLALLLASGVFLVWQA